jgi:serine/threonine protein kinase
MIGKTLDHYQIKSEIGKGGMGEVYQAKDQVLGREVALKFLPDAFAGDPERMARFEREAKVLASLNHPNIAAIYGLEQAEGKRYIVMELVEGETLAQRLSKGPLPVEEALGLCRQIAEGLEAAHEKGVIHRDLKPANVMITEGDRVKILDFGLAKALSGETQAGDLSQSPTITDAMTQPGIVLGTAAYMSPEQAKGKAVDKRSDIWAFGCILYECLTGKRAFDGETVTEALASILKSEPEWKALPENLHPRIRLLLERSLKKDPRDRYSSISDGRVDIQDVVADPRSMLVQTAITAPERKVRLSLPAIAVIVVLSFIIAGLTVWKFKPAEPRQVIRFEYEVPDGQRIATPTFPLIAASPEGTRFVYGTPDGLYLRSVAELNARLIPGTRGALSPFFSPDGQWVGYFSFFDKQLKKVSVTGGPPVTLCPTSSMQTGASWGRDGTIVYGGLFEGIMRVSADGGRPECIVKMESTSLSFPQILPDAKAVIFTETSSTSSSPKIVVQSLTKGIRKVLLEGFNARYLPTRHLVFCSGNNLFAVQFDPEKLEIRGASIPLVEDVFSMPSLSAQWDVSDSGTLVYLQKQGSITELPLKLLWVDREGKEEPIPAESNAYFFPRISPDGTRIALSVGGPMNADIWIWDLMRSGLSRFTLDAVGSVGLWTPDGKRITYTSERTNTVYWKAADGTGKGEVLTTQPGLRLYPWSWANNGKILILEEYPDGNIGMLSLEGERKWKPLLQEKYRESQPQISPDGRWLAYTSNESGKEEIYVRPFPNINGGRWKISTNGGKNSLWSPNAREVFFRNEDAVIAVPVKTDPIFSPETAKVLFRGKYFYAGPVVGTLWDISPDGKRFLMIKEQGTTASGGSGPRKINIVINWFEELKQRVPVK